MARKKYIVSCPYCGNAETYQSVYTKMEVRQFYDWNGNANGYIPDEEGKETRGVYCAVCDRRITTLDRLVGQGEERGLYLTGCGPDGEL